MAVFCNESRHNIRVTINSCVFDNNYARLFGGGVYLLLGGFGTHHRILMERTHVVSNVGQIGGGGIHAVFFNSGPEEDPLLMTFVDCEIYNNSAQAGAGIYVYTDSKWITVLQKMSKEHMAL